MKRRRKRRKSRKTAEASSNPLALITNPKSPMVPILLTLLGAAAVGGIVYFAFIKPAAAKQLPPGGGGGGGGGTCVPPSESVRSGCIKGKERYQVTLTLGTPIGPEGFDPNLFIQNMQMGPYKVAGDPNATSATTVVYVIDSTSAASHTDTIDTFYGSLRAYNPSASIQDLGASP